MATWRKQEPYQEPDPDLQFQLAPGTAVKIEPSPLDPPRLINLPSSTHRDSLTLIRETHHRDWPHQFYRPPGLSLDWRPTQEETHWSTFLPSITLSNLIRESITNFDTIHMYIKRLTWLHWFLNTLRFRKKKIFFSLHKIYNKIPYCCAQLRWSDNSLYLLTLHHHLFLVCSYIRVAVKFLFQMHFQFLPTLACNLFWNLTYPFNCPEIRPSTLF